MAEKSVGLGVDVQASSVEVNQSPADIDWLQSIGFSLSHAGMVHLPCLDKVIEDYDGKFGLARVVLRLIVCADDTSVELHSYNEAGSLEGSVGLTKVNARTRGQVLQLLDTLGAK